MNGAEEWLWHLFHDPMRANPWSIVALVVIVALAMFALVGGAAGARRISRTWRRKSVV